MRGATGPDGFLAVLGMSKDYFDRSPNSKCVSCSFYERKCKNSASDFASTSSLSHSEGRPETREIFIFSRIFGFRCTQIGRERWYGPRRQGCNICTANRVICGMDSKGSENLVLAFFRKSVREAGKSSGEAGELGGLGGDSPPGKFGGFNDMLFVFFS